MAFFLFLLLNSFWTPAHAIERIIFDTDSAYFSDDGVALAMLLAEPNKVVIDGMTIVAGNFAPRQGAEYMLHVLELTHAKVPVYLGANEPLYNNRKMAAEMMRKWKLNFAGSLGRPPILQASDVTPPSGGKFSLQRPEKKDAVSYIRERLENSPEPMTFFAIGPMTNLARVLKMKPALAQKIKRLVYMGGTAHVPGNITPYAEFNFWFDPDAANVVLQSAIK